MPRTITAATPGYAPASKAKDYAQRLVRLYGSINAAGRAFDERHSHCRGAGVRLLDRLLNDRQEYVSEDTLDRLWVLL
jgi:hypothetical protein